jgi:NADPH-dependent 2,4-dienoyl-CoA reductase/sulfur reductase-like enzyme
MNNPNEKYGFGPKTRDGRNVVITGITKEVSYPVNGVCDGIEGAWEWDGTCTTYPCGCDLIPLSELATCNESLHVQNVSQEDLDRLLGVQEGVSTLVQRLHVCGHVHCAESKAEIERLQAELIEYKNRRGF